MRLLLALVCLTAPRILVPQAQGIPALHELVQGLGVSGRVLVVAAHPDDEDTQLITWLARSRHVETAYLSLTRGDGGQNLIGNELGEALGVIRTEELLAARRIDGGRQYFTRAYDFGFSKSAEEAFAHWPKDSLLRDVISVVRAFRPHVIISMFSGTPRDGHGQHQAAGILAREAYDLAGDTVRFPVASTGGSAAWTPLKFYRGAWASRDAPDVMRINVGEYDAMLGRSYAEIAGESRSQHKSQGFGSLERRGVRFTPVRREATRVNPSQDPAAERSIFDGIDTTWAPLEREATDSRLRQLLREVPRAIAAVRESGYLRDPSAAVSPLARLQTLLPVSAVMNSVKVVADPKAQTPIQTPDETVRELRALQERASSALTIATGVVAEAQAERELFSAGDSARVMLTVYNRGRLPVRANPYALYRCQRGEERADGSTFYSSLTVIEPDSAATILPDSSRSWRGWLCSDRGRAERGPYWLAGRQGDLFRSSSAQSPTGEATAGPVWPVTVQLLGGAALDAGFDLLPPLVYRYADPVRGDVSRPVAFVPAVTVTLDRAVEFARANAPLDRMVSVTVRSADTTAREVRVSLTVPEGLYADSVSRSVTIPNHRAARTVAFRVRGRLTPGHHEIRALAESRGERFATGYQAIDYPHIRPQRIYRDAALDLQAVDVRLPARITVGYIRGVGDNVAPALSALGVPLTVIEPSAIPATELSKFSAVVVGPRAYESSAELVANNSRLLEFARNGGTLVVQYGQYEMTQPGMMPFPITINRPHDRVTDENAPVRIVEGAASLLNYPNRIGDADFRGWVQERSLYMPRTFDKAYTAVLSMNDPGEAPNNGALLVAPYGKGVYVYTSLAFFRQLPAGVPGAARLFLNLLAASQNVREPAQ